MPTSTAKQPAFTNRILGVFIALSFFGMAGLAVMVIVGFEEPNNTLLLFSSVLIFAAPIAILAHLSVTKELTRQEKRIWIRELTGPRAPWVFTAYLTCHDRRATAESLAAEALTRSRNRRTERQ